MRYYFAPLEGLTDSTYRQLHHKYFPGIDRYYTPFISPTMHKNLTKKEQRELQPAHTLGFSVVPQALTRNPEDFLWLARQCADAGYKELNLNTGCPSGTVTAKGKGAGLLRDLDTLDRFLEDIFAAQPPIDISVKTRIGYDDPAVFPALLTIFNRYPITELTIHPRTRSAFYNGDVNMDAFRYAVANSKNPLCYNGNLCTKEQIESFAAAFPTVDAVMLGRGLIGNPGMLSPGGINTPLWEQFHDELLDAYSGIFGSSRNAMFRMKENWHYWICLFNGGEKLYKQLRKATTLSDYQSAVRQLFTTVPLRHTLTPNW